MKRESRAMDVQTKQLMVVVILLVILLAVKTSSQPEQGCPGQCGSLRIPYPFGTREGCYLDPSFLINCSQTSNTAAPTPFLRRSNIEVVSISLEDADMRISIPVAQNCYKFNSSWTTLNLKNFYVSTSRNKFIVVGCHSLGFIVENQESKNYTVGCVSLCNRLDDVLNGSCSGIGCCQTSIPEGISSFKFFFGTLYNMSVPDFNPCGYAFVVEEEAYNFSSKDLINFPNKTMPVVLDWAVGSQTCEKAKNNLSSFACKADHSECNNSAYGVGYRCMCSHGFRGNPYLLDGCQDIDECKESHNCGRISSCHNFPGGYNCSCPKDYEGDGTINGTGCHLIASSNSRSVRLLIIGLSVSSILLILLVVIFYVYWELNQRKLAKLRKKNFHQNGGILLQQQIAKHQGSVETPKIFTADDLHKATNNYDDDRVLGQGGNGTVYKGVLQENRVVAIKKSKISDQSQIEHFINEVIVLSQINHRNVVKLLGCCLETEVPLLVYEYVNNGTLFDHLHDESKVPKLSWTVRLKVAKETAGVLAYLHSATSTPIIHRDVKATNILLDDNLTAKVSDFGSSKLVPLDKTQLTTLVQGTLGYLDPEYLQTSQLTEKSDVYSFGVVLAELLTSKKALSFDGPESDRSLSVYFVSSMKEGNLLQIVDKSIIKEASAKQIMEVANIAKRCLRVTGEERPTMKEVAMELEGLEIVGNHLWGGKDMSSEENEPLIQAPSPPRILDVEEGDGSSCSSTMIGFDSLKNKNLESLRDGR